MLAKFWNGFEIPAYKQGEVEVSAELPYITYPVETGDAFTQMVSAVFVWCKNNPQGVKIRREVMDRISKQIKAQSGITLQVPDKHGNILICRNDGIWQSYGNDPEEKTVIYGRVSIQTSYNLE